MKSMLIPAAIGISLAIRDAPQKYCKVVTRVSGVKDQEVHPAVISFVGK